MVRMVFGKLVHQILKLRCISLTSLVLILLSSSVSEGLPVRVAFFRGYDDQNKRIELLKGGQFFHTAIQIQGQWYHTSTTYGVKTIADLSSLIEEGMRVHSMLESGDWNLTKGDIEFYLGLPFDYFYEWECKNKTDCTKFIAQLLKVSPTRNSFSGDHWKKSDYGINKVSVGVSPDELYRSLKKKGFYDVSPQIEVHFKSSKECRSLLKK